MERFYDELKRFESNMRTAARSSYTRNIPVRQRRRLYEIYNALTGRAKVYKASCPACLVEVLAGLWGLYSGYVKVDELADIGEKELNEPIETKPKRVRKPKNDGKVQE